MAVKTETISLAKNSCCRESLVQKNQMMPPDN